MAKNYRVDFQAIKARADFGAVLAHYGLNPTGRGDQVKVRCPFHDDERPSLSVNLADGLFHCFGGGCGLEGNVLEFVHRMETRGGSPVTLRQAAVTLAEICHIPLEGGEPRKGPRTALREAARPEMKQTSSQGVPARPGGPDEPGKAVAEATEPKRNKPLGFTLRLDPAHPYLAGRGLSPATIETFGLGYCAKGIMAGRVCIPLGNAAGETVAYAGRWVGSLEELPEGKSKYELPKGFHKALELFNLHRVKEARHLVVVEGYFGAIRLHELEVPVVALMGSSISDEQVALLQAHCPNLRALTVLMDGDEPGRKAADVVAARLARHWWVRIAELPDGTQPDTVEDAELCRLRLTPSERGAA